MKFILALFLAIGMTSLTHAKSDEIGNNIDVNHYEIHLNEINIADRTIDAKTIISFTTLSSVNEIDLELKSLNVTSVTSSEANISDFSQNGDVLSISFSSSIAENSNVSLTIEYNGSTFNENWGGIHWSNDYVYNLGVGFDSQPHNLGKTWFPCVDNFNDKASYDLFITYPENIDRKSVV